MGGKREDRREQSIEEGFRTRMIPDCLRDTSGCISPYARRCVRNFESMSGQWGCSGLNETPAKELINEEWISRGTSGVWTKMKPCMRTAQSTVFCLAPSPVRCDNCFVLQNSYSSTQVQKQAEDSPWDADHEKGNVSVVEGSRWCGVRDSDVEGTKFGSFPPYGSFQREGHHSLKTSQETLIEYEASRHVKPFVCQKPSGRYVSQEVCEPFLQKCSSRRPTGNVPILWKRYVPSERMYRTNFRFELPVNDEKVVMGSDHHEKGKLSESFPRVSERLMNGVKEGKEKHFVFQEMQGLYEFPASGTQSTAMTSASPCRENYHLRGSSCAKTPRKMNMLHKTSYFKGPERTPRLTNRRLYNTRGPLSFSSSPMQGARHHLAELRSWGTPGGMIISQNSSKRKVYRGVWLCAEYPTMAFPVAIKFVEDGNSRDGRSVKREIECHLFIYQKLSTLQKEEGYGTLEDAWPSAELLGYHLNKKNPGQCTLITRKLSGPDFFDVIRQETNRGEIQQSVSYQYHKLYWCFLALKRIQQYARLGLRHNDVKPDNIVLDFYVTSSGSRALDVKIIDLGTASMQGAKEFTGGTSWYESPEQKMLEYYSKKQRNSDMAKKIDIGFASDVWAAGVSITEVLVGRRIVDVMRAPYGPGPLNYKGAQQGWCVDPYQWIDQARRLLLQTPREMPQHTFTLNAAKYIFDLLVRPDPKQRGSVEHAIAKLKQEAANALEHSQQYPSMTRADWSPELLFSDVSPKSSQLHDFCSTGATVRAMRYSPGAHGEEKNNNHMCHPITTSNLSELSS